MASFRFIGPPSPSVYQPPAAPKLRDSCDACASSKVKCHKEKPTCSRCSKRGVKCIYVSAKRGNRGRKLALSGGSSTASKSSSAAPPPQQSQPESWSRSPETASSLTTPNNGSGMDDGGDMVIDPQLMNDWFSVDTHGMDFMDTPLGHSGTTDVSPVGLNLQTGSKLDFSTSFLNGDKSLSPFGSADLGSMLMGDGSLSTPLGDGNLFGEPFASPIPFSLLPSSVDTETLSSHNTDQLASGGSGSVADIMNLDMNSDKVSSSASWAGKGKEKEESMSDSTALRLDTKVKATQTASEDVVDMQPFGEELPGDFHETCQCTGGNSSCSCMVRALGLLSKLLIFPPHSAASTRASTGRTTPETLFETSFPENLPTLQQVMEANGQAVQALSAMMQLPCACSQNGYLLVIVSTIIFKVLAWYAMVATRTDEYSALESCLSSIDPPATLPSSSSSTSSGQHHTIRRSKFSNGLTSMDAPKTVDNYSVRGDDSNRMAAQQVLSELHRVHRLVGLWSAKLRMKKEEESFSAGMLQHAEAGMKKKLKQLSKGIVEYLSHS